MEMRAGLESDGRGVAGTPTTLATMGRGRYASRGVVEEAACVAVESCDHVEVEVAAVITYTTSGARARCQNKSHLGGEGSGIHLGGHYRFPWSVGGPTLLLRSVDTVQEGEIPNPILSYRPGASLFSHDAPALHFCVCAGTGAVPRAATSAVA